MNSARRKSRVVVQQLFAVLMLLLCRQLFAQGSTPSSAVPLTPGSLLPGPGEQGYGGDLATRSTLTGDWGGRRDELAAHGYIFNLGITQIVQGNAGGGVKVPNIYRFETSQDVEVYIDTEKAGWWQGGRFRFLIQAREGLSVNATQGSIYAVNMDALFPVPFPLNQDVWAFSVYSYTHTFSPQYALTVGKIQNRPANEFASSEKTQFFSNKINLLPPFGSIIPTSDFWGYLLGYQATRRLAITFIIANPESTADTFKPYQLFRGPLSFGLVSSLLVTPDGHPGHQRLALAYTSQRHTLVFAVPGVYLVDLPTNPPTPVIGERTDWLLAWDMDQYFFNVDHDPHRGLGIFAKVTYSDGRVNAIRDFMNVGIGAKGVSCSRPDDSFGFAYACSALSKNIPTILKPFVQDENGIEFYYNYAVTPWFHLSPDVQWLTHPTRISAGSPIVLGLRAQMAL